MHRKPWNQVGDQEFLISNKRLLGTTSSDFCMWSSTKKDLNHFCHAIKSPSLIKTGKVNFLFTGQIWFTGTQVLIHLSTWIPNCTPIPNWSWNLSYPISTGDEEFPVTFLLSVHCTWTFKNVYWCQEGKVQEAVRDQTNNNVWYAHACVWKYEWKCLKLRETVHK